MRYCIKQIWAILRFIITSPIVVVGFLYGMIKEAFRFGVKAFELFSDYEDDYFSK